jgi:hypothetical protein
MSKGSTAKRKNGPVRPAGAQHQLDRNNKRFSADADEPIVFAPPPKPRPRLFVVLSVVLALWVAFLLATYFSSVYRQGGSREAPHASQPALP